MVFENMFVFRETDVSGCISCPLDGHCEFVKCKEKEGMQNVLDKQDKG